MPPHSPATDLAMHTAEPWSVAEDAFDNDGVEESVIRALDGLAVIAVTLDFGPNNPSMRQANARRIVACVNACVGIPNEVLECDTPTFIAMLQERHSLRLQRDDLLAALKEMVSEFGGRDPIFGGERAVVCKARSALARAEGREVKG